MLILQIRAIGGDCSHPGAFEFMRRLRILQLGHFENIKIWTNNPAVMMEPSSENELENHGNSKHTKHQKMLER